MGRGRRREPPAGEKGAPRKVRAQSTAAAWAARQHKPIIARGQTDHGSGLGRHRWVVDRTFAWLHNRRRLLIRTDRRDDIHEGFLALACCLICWRRLETSLS